MQFTRLRLQGFKSFVDPADLVISAGLTGVVGPNGCGKSNLLEALRWVMGESRAKQMRGDEMEDVIFAGAASRPARNTASVDLVIDNSDRLAPAEFNDSDSLEVSRRITRDVGSAYALNGKNVRARDVQMLFADASTGAHSPALVRQGRIAELIAARPQARRKVLEEAAGISGLYQRRHEAELKLNAAEANLGRVEDILESLSSRLRDLERQAGQAKRYREIADELRRAEAVSLFLRWQAADAERLAAEDKLQSVVTELARAEGEVLRMTGAKDEADAALAPLREAEVKAAAAHQRLVVEGERLEEAERHAVEELEALGKRIRIMGLDVDRETALGKDADATIARLDEEAKALETEHAGHPEAAAKAQKAMDVAGGELSERESALDRLTEEAARLAAEVSAIEGRRNEAGAAAERIADEIEAAKEQEKSLVAGMETAREARDAARAEETAGRDRAEKAEAALQQAESALGEARNVDAEARAALSEAEGVAGALASEVEALEQLPSQDDSGGEEADGRIVDRVQVAPGYEAALGAALGDDLQLGLAEEGAEDGSGWRELEPIAGGELPDPLLAHVSGPPELNRVLNRRLARVGLVADRVAGDQAQNRLTPGQRLVSRDGDLWRWDGVRVRAGDATSTTAHRLRQKNLIAARKTALAEAEMARAAAEAACAEADARLAEAVAAERACRETRQTADQAVAEAFRAGSSAEADLAMCKSRLEAQKTTLETRAAEREAAETDLREAVVAVEGLDDPGAARAAVEVERGKVEQARAAMLSARSAADELHHQGTAREKRMADIGREREDWIARRDRAVARVEELTQRIKEAEADREAATGRPAEFAEKRAALKSSIGESEDRRRAEGDALAVAETALREAEKRLRDAERAASECRETRARAEVVRDSAQEKVADAVAAIATELEVAPEALADSVGLDSTEMSDLARADTDVAKLRRQRDSLGMVNLRAEEDAAGIRVEHDALAAEKADLDAAVAKLRSGIKELNREGRSRIIRAFEEVNTKFSDLFRVLFGGGEARLTMVESDDPLEAGLEILCRPPGKKLSNLSLLSGGEQALAALSLIFAIFLANPAPVCVLDEVDAPLDDGNVIRFCDLLDEMVRRTETRFLIITHHAITISRMDRLFGVTMVEPGVSRLVSVDLARAAELVEEPVVG